MSLERPTYTFPDPRTADEDGIVAFGGDLQPVTLLTAYRRGIFPWPIRGLPLAWFCPAERAVLESKQLHIPKSLEKFARKAPYRLSINENFESVIDACADRGKEGTWITAGMRKAYIELHLRGYAHSAEAWMLNASGKEDLIGGIYGVCVDGVFSAESMFHRRPNAGKLALLHLFRHLEKGGLTWMDIQVMTPHMEKLGARLISRDQFLEWLVLAHSAELHPFGRPKRTTK